MTEENPQLINGDKSKEKRESRKPFWLACLLVILLFCMFLYTSQLIPLTWDEPDAFNRVVKMSKWFELVGQRFQGDVTGESATVFSKETILKYWPHTMQNDGHPSGYTLVILTGKQVSQWLHLDFISEKVRFRLGDLFLFSLAIGVCFYRVWKSFSPTAAWFVVLAILCIPRVFSHVQIAACDSPLISTWLLTWALFESGLKNGRMAVIWGIALGMGLSMKFSGWIMPFPFLIFTGMALLTATRIRGIWRLWLIGGPVALLVFWCLNPTLWHDPFADFQRFVSLNTYETRMRIDVSIRFLGNIYSWSNPLPWYNTLFWTAITVPVGLLFLALYTLACEFFSSLFRKKEAGTNHFDKDGLLDHRSQIVLIFLNYFMLIFIRALPGTPAHDGVRLFVAAFPFLGILAGLGAARLWERNQSPTGSSPERRHGFPASLCKKIHGQQIFVLSIFGFSLFNLFWYAPQWLSYYNAAIGGLKGAVAAGMETTYFWDGLDREVTDWLRDHTDYNGSRTGQKEMNCYFFYFGPCLDYNRTWGVLGPGCTVYKSIYDDHEKIKWYVFQVREGNNALREFPSLTSQPTAFDKYIRKGGWWIWNLGDTPLIRIYDSKLCPEAAHLFDADFIQKNMKKSRALKRHNRNPSSTLHENE